MNPQEQYAATLLSILMPDMAYKSARGPYASRIEKGFARAAEHSQDNYMGGGIWLITGESNVRIYAVDVEWLTCNIYAPAYHIEPCHGPCHHLFTALKLEADRLTIAAVKREALDRWEREKERHARLRGYDMAEDMAELGYSAA
jgi:hypothetical protein